jgi:hypothetical protein
MKEFLDNFAAILGAATIALLLFAVCHEYGYFWVIGSQFQTFVSTSDSPILRSGSCSLQ